MRLYDTKCYQLARDFLGDEDEINTEENRDELACEIQNVIEDTIGDMRDRQKHGPAPAGEPQPQAPEETR